MAELLPETVVNLLDLGCGTGLELDEIFKIRPNIKVTGVDLSKAMLGILNKKTS
ncbi:trans-aconitate 2-methyltransferase [Atribacter sp.]|uniref:class I SAM-dependent methyltransferase n=1 Tax=Atribacter sp. TaxID=2847780 RepID=UPI00345E9179